MIGTVEKGRRQSRTLGTRMEPGGHSRVRPRQNAASGLFLPPPRPLLLLFVLALGSAGGLGRRAEAAAETIRFAGIPWTARSGEGGPGPNIWEKQNVWVDTRGGLHLRIRLREGKWSCAEVTSQQRLGFGRYRFQVEGPIDRLDDHVVLGLFNYPTSDVGGDATHEIDIEFARWGRATNPIGNYTVWPVEKALGQTSKTFAFSLSGPGSTHRFDWSPARVLYRSWQGYGEDGTEIARWDYEPADANRRLARQAMPVHINFWLFQGKPPKDGKEVEVVIRSFAGPR